MIHGRSPDHQRGGFTIAETMAALGVLAVTMLVVAQVGVWSLQEYARHLRPAGGPGAGCKRARDSTRISLGRA